MRSETSSSKSWFYPTLWKKNMARFWPIWAVYGVCWLFAMPLALLSNYGYMSNKGYFSTDLILEYASWPCTMASVVFGILAAMAVFSYLYNSRSAGMIHALPVRREGLFLTNYLSGLSFMVLPAGAVGLLTLLAEAAVGQVDAGALGIWFLSLVCQSLFFYSFAVFCAMFTGHILALPAFYGILNGLAAGLYWLIYQLFDAFVFGYAGDSGMGAAVLWLTPAAKLGGELNAWTEGGVTRFGGMGYALLYALVGLALAALALVLYRRRHLEGAGDVVTIRWVRPIFKYGVAFCAALSLGTLLFAWFGNPFGGSAWVLLVFLILCGAVGYFAAQMLLKKAFRVFADSWKGCLVFSLCLVALVAAVELDVTGFERRVPDPSQVVQVTMTGPHTSPDDSSRYFTLSTEDPTVIRAVTDLHAAVVAERSRYDHDGGNRHWTSECIGGVVDGLEVDSIQVAETVNFSLRYELVSGSVVKREYVVPVYAADAADPDSLYARLTALVNRPEDKVAMYFNQELVDQMRLMDVSISMLRDDKDGNGYYTDYLSLDNTRRADLFSAVKADLAAGRLGIRYLMEDADRLSNCYVNDLQFTFRLDMDTVLHEADYDQRVAADTGVGRETYTVTITLQDTATETMALLREMGVDQEVPLLTQAQRQHQYWLEER